VTVQPFASVPYALYAKDAANVKEYVAGSNISISAPSSGNTYTINSSGSSSSNATITVAPSSHLVTSNGNIHQLTIASPSFANSTNAVNMAGTFPNYVLNYQYPTLSVTGNSILAISQGTYTSPAITLTNVSSGPWSTSLTNAYLSSGYDNVGVGTNAPVAKLDIFTSTASTNNAIGAHALGGNGIFVTTISSNSINAAVLANNNGSGSGVFATASNPSSFVSGVQGINTGGGAGVFGNNTSGSSSTGAHGVNGKTNGTAPFASGVMAESYGNGPGLYGYQGSGGASSSAHGVFGVTNSSSASGVYGMNSSFAGGPGVTGIITGAPASANSHGVKGETNASNSIAAGVFGDNKGIGTGVVGTNTTSSTAATAHGVKGVTNAANTNVAGVMGESLNSGPSVFGFKAGSSNLGNAGRFEIAANNNLAEAVLVNHNGGGIGLSVSSNTNYGIRSTNNSNTYPAIFANNLGPNASLYAEKTATQVGDVARLININAANSNPALMVTNYGNGPAVSINTMSSSVVALQIAEGHLKSLGAPPTLGAVAVSGISPVPTVSATINNATDIKGIVAINYNGAITGITNSAFFEVPVIFNKPYSAGSTPVVILTPTTDLLGLSYRVLATSSTGFTIRVYRTANTTFTVPTNIPSAGAFTFNYIVIE
jgi:hypothetical protein